MAAPSATLVLSTGSRWSDTYHLDPHQKATLGRSSDCELVLRADGISRRHAELAFDSASNRWTIRDLGSRNGTRVDGRLIDVDTSLRSGQSIDIAGVRIRFFDQRESPLPPPSSPTSSVGESFTQGTITLDPDAPIDRIATSRYVTAPSPVDADNPARRAELLSLVMTLARTTDRTGAIQIVTQWLQRLAPGVGLIPADGRLDLRTTEAFPVVQPDAISATIDAVLGECHEPALARHVTVAPQPPRDWIVVPIGSPNPGALIHGHCVVAGDDRHRLSVDDLHAAVAVAEMLAARLDDLGRQRQLSESLSDLRDRVIWMRQSLDRPHQVIGRSGAIKKAIDAVRRIAPMQTPVLIHGPPGGGKSHLAAALHHASRSDTPLIVCDVSRRLRQIDAGSTAGIAQWMTQWIADWFDATTGLMRAAHRGTLLIENVQQLPPPIAQAWWNWHAGGHEAGPDVRVVTTAPTAALDSLDDPLRQWLSGETIAVPSLQQRREDIAPLAEHFLRSAIEHTRRPPLAFGVDTLEQLTQSWNGRIETLRQSIDQLSDTLVTGPIEMRHFDQTSNSPGDDTPHDDTLGGNDETLDRVVERHINRVLRQTGGNRTRAAERLGIQRSTLIRRLAKRDETAD